MRLVIFSALVVAEERKDQAAPAGSISIARERPDMRDRTGFGVDSSGDRGILHALVQGAIDTRDGKRGIVRGKPRLLLSKLQEGNEGARGDHVVARESGAIGLDDVLVGDASAGVKLLGKFEQVVRSRPRALLARSGAEEDFGVEILADLVDQLYGIAQGQGKMLGENRARGCSGIRIMQDADFAGELDAAIRQQLSQ